MHTVPMELHRAPDPVPVDDPMPLPFDNPHPHHPPGHMPRDDDAVPDPKPEVSAARFSRVQH